MRQEIKQLLAKMFFVAMLGMPLSLSAYAREPADPILNFAIGGKATPSNATPSDADEVDNFIDYVEEDAIVSTPSNANLATDSNAESATPSNAQLATDSNAEPATPSNAALPEKKPFKTIGGYFRNEHEYVLPNAQKDGYEFVEWNTEEDGSGLSYMAGESLRITGEMNLYAIWDEIPEHERN